MPHLDALEGSSLVGLLKASYLRSTRTNQLAECHYKRFLGSHPDIPEYFEGINRAEHLLLLRAMHSVLWRIDENASGDFVKATMLRLARKHGRAGLDVPKSLYRYWLTSLVGAVAQCDPEFDAPIEKAWNAIGQYAIDLVSGEIAD